MDDETKAMFSTAGIDTVSIQTEADYRKAFAKAGDFFFSRLIETAQTGNDASHAVLEAFLDGRITDAKALMRRQTFKVIPGGIVSLPRSSGS